MKKTKEKTQQAYTKNVKCVKCNTGINGSWAFCTRCGTRVETVSNQKLVLAENIMKLIEKAVEKALENENKA